MTELKDILGKPGEGVHVHGWLNIVWVDVLGTVGLATVSAWYFCRSDFWLALPLWFVLLFCIGEALHLAIGVDTTIARCLKSVWQRL